MNTCVSDDNNIVNIQGIRFVSWGESSIYNASVSGKFYVSVTYKGNHQNFQYRDEVSARSFFNKIRDAMDKSKKDK